MKYNTNNRQMTWLMTALATTLIGMGLAGMPDTAEVKRYNTARTGQEYHAVFSKTDEVPPEEAKRTPTLSLSPGASTKPDTKTRYPLFENDTRYRGEIDTIRWATQDINLTDAQMRLLLAIRMAENGGPGIEFGVLPDSAGPTTTYRNDPGIDRRDTPEREEIDYASGPGGAAKASLAQQARWAALTILANDANGREDIPMLGKRYSPSAENPNWVRIVTDRFDYMLD